MDNITEIIGELSTAIFYPTDNTSATGLVDIGNVTTPRSLDGPGKPEQGGRGERGHRPPMDYSGEGDTWYKIILPIILSVGTIGNLLTVLVLLRGWKTFSSTSMYLMVLAISDTGVLYTEPFRNLIQRYADIDVRHSSEVGCKLNVYFTNACLQFSSWVLVAISLERAASVVIPHKVKLGCTLKTACFVIVSMFITIFGLNIPHLINFGLHPMCGPLNNYGDFFNHGWPFIDFTLVFAVPFVTLLVCNVIIIVHLQKSRTKRSRMTASHGHRGNTSQRDLTSLSILLISLCVVFFLSMTPSAVFSFYYPVKRSEISNRMKMGKKNSKDDMVYLNYQRDVVNIVSYTNASLNFILYVFSGTKFRAGLVAFFARNKKPTSGGTVQRPHSEPPDEQTGQHQLSQMSLQHGNNHTT